MKLIKRTEIDDKKWNDCVLKSPNGLVYGLTWFLDALVGDWNGIIIESNGSYEAVFPVPFRSKFGLKYVYPPFFIQQLGLFTKEVVSEREVAFLKLLTSKYKFVELNLNYSSSIGEEQVNLVLGLKDEYESIRARFSKNHIRNINKADKSDLVLDEYCTAQDVISLFKNDRGADLATYTSKDYQNFSSLVDSQIKGKIATVIGVRSKGVLVCGAVFFRFKNRLTFLFSGNSQRGKDVGALFFLLNSVVKKYAKSGFMLDFEGSQNEGLQRFYKGFGATEENYRFYKVNNLPSILKRFKQ